MRNIFYTWTSKWWLQAMYLKKTFTEYCNGSEIYLRQNASKGADLLNSIICCHIFMYESRKRYTLSVIHWTQTTLVSKNQKKKPQLWFIQFLFYSVQLTGLNKIKSVECDSFRLRSNNDKDDQVIVNITCNSIKWHALFESN